MSGTFTSATITVSIDRPPAEVSAYVRDARNLPRWLTSFVTSAAPEADGWQLQTSAGTMHWRFSAENAFGVLDHDVTLPEGVVVHNAMRVVPNGEGSDVIFSLLQRPGMSDIQFEADRSMVATDLAALKAVLEAS